MRSFAVHILDAFVVPPNGLIQFQLLKNGVQVAFIQFNPGDNTAGIGGIRSIAFPALPFAVNELLDVAVITSPNVHDGNINVSAMIA